MPSVTQDATVLLDGGPHRDGRENQQRARHQRHHDTDEPDRDRQRDQDDPRGVL